MAGAAQQYRHTPAYYSDMFELGYEAVCRLDARLRTVAHWQERYREGVIYYLEQSRIVGILLWNVWDKVDEAREILREAVSPMAAAAGRLAETAPHAS